MTTTEPNLTEYRIDGCDMVPVMIEHDVEGCDWSDMPNFDNPTVEHILDKIRRHHAAVHT